MTAGEAEPRRLMHFTPLRYPGGKGKLAAYVKELIRANNLFDGEYVEPYAGGAAIALELLFQEYVSRIHINDLSQPVYSFWKAVLNDSEELCRMIKDTRLSVASWDRQKKIFANPRNHSYVQLGFATFFLNRTNRSGILNAGVIGGRDQTGPWKLDARYNADELIFRIESIAKMRSRIKLTQSDALALLRFGLRKWPENTLIYLDPPYYDQGRNLYYDYYKPDDHADLASFIAANMNERHWIVSYDNVDPIKALYAKFRSVVYNVGYSARETRVGKEVMFFSPRVNVPDLVGPIQQVEKTTEAA
ncbi:DNA adenine methylase [Mesorhizobium sp. L-8-3]|uniref:DNA adenine methylase n=1 Tax=Mesorhizobium sp. L-8-3 TaxID=2744522 RepID=UPI00192560A5|nr:DNA adenine methylase [Mesorhizobium sp. L-8-3]BCH23583.1 DNA methyltransferase [Mesorhizobium sp. L-8-3]